MKTDKAHLKKEILTAGVKKHQAIMDDFQNRIKEMMANDGKVNEEEYDSHLQSQRAEAVTEVSLLSDQLQFAGRELYELKRLEWSLEEEHRIVAFGTVVVTDQETFFVSASIEQFSVNGQPIFGLSVLSPIYKNMRKKKVGETFKYGSKDYIIKEIF